MSDWEQNIHKMWAAVCGIPQILAHAHLCLSAQQRFWLPVSMYSIKHKSRINLDHRSSQWHQCIELYKEIKDNKCDAIKQNESELEKINTWFSCSLYASTSELYYTENTINIEHTVPEISPIYTCSKQSNTKEIECYYCLYLKINISEFRLILLDLITNYWITLMYTRITCGLITGIMRYNFSMNN